jgi:predicted DNA-binding protein
MPLSPSALSELDEATTQQVHRDLKDWSDLSEPLRSGRSPWAGTHITTDAEARGALDACIGLAGEITSGWQTQQGLLSDDLGIDDAGSFTEWGKVVAEVSGLARDIARTKSALTLEVFERNLNQMSEDLAPGAKSVLSRLFNKRYKAARAEIDNLVPGSPKLGARAALDAVDAARSQSQRWADLGCAGSPRIPVSIETAAEAFDKMKGAVDTLASLMPGRNLSRETVDGIAAIAQELLKVSTRCFACPNWPRWNCACELLMSAPYSKGSEATTFQPAGSYPHSTVLGYCQSSERCCSKTTDYRGSREAGRAAM